MTSKATNSAAVTKLCGLLNADRKISPSGCARTAACDPLLKRLQLRVQALKVADERHYDRSPGGALGLPGTPLRRRAELLQQARRRLATRVVLSFQKPGEPLLAQAASVSRARVALDERQRDLAVEV